MQHPPCNCRACGDKRLREKRPPCPEPCACADPCVEIDPCPPKPPRPRPPKPPKPCPSPHGRCVTPPRPMKPVKQMKPKTESVLLQKIIACERRTVPSLCAELALEGLPACAQPPYTLLSVRQSGAQPWWTPLESHCPDDRLHIRVTVPLCCQVRDACGKAYCATATVDADASLRPPCGMPDCRGCSFFVIPCVRMLCAECCSDDELFNVRLELSMEIYLLRPEPCMMRKPEPPCPELPLYPPPAQPTPPCWPQCPAAPAPCGWPAQG